MAEEESYWVKREKENIKKEQMKDEEVAEKLREIIENAQREILKEIDVFYSRYAENNNITPAEAKKRVSEFDVQSFEKTAARYVEEKNFSDKANEELYTYNTKMRVSRQELLMMYLNAHLVAMADEQVQTFQDYLEQAGINEVARQAGILDVNMTITTSTLESLVGASFYEATWSERIWDDMEGLREELDVIINNAIVRGVHPDRGVSNLRERFDVTTYEARRLLITETARVQTGAQQLSYEALTEDNDEAEYEFIAVIDDDTTETCEDLNGEIFKVKDMMPGVNASPMHPFCRSSSALRLGDWRTNFFAEREGKYSL
ncbi:minor capsid protein [Alkalibacillus salilacus]|uniref:SPP1 gp7 family putative phage head morphogenesis protein n=1 Tax=Alkalibacillus salilacus TaxID=284582 RepID=A0ABT9VCX4_9BACI|nr:minor capsid protein [Alkalibacillus salilacus]MDQ0158814.1 SPP1 gp7 family putative phage head morphogenesis protein [Alkalibacillus salilacus]